MRKLLHLCTLLSFSALANGNVALIEENNAFSTHNTKQFCQDWAKTHRFTTDQLKNIYNDIKANAYDRFQEFCDPVKDPLLCFHLLEGDSYGYIRPEVVERKDGSLLFSGILNTRFEQIVSLVRFYTSNIVSANKQLKAIENNDGDYLAFNNKVCHDFSLMLNNLKVGLWSNHELWLQDRISGQKDSGAATNPFLVHGFLIDAFKQTLEDVTEFKKVLYRNNDGKFSVLTSGNKKYLLSRLQVGLPSQDGTLTLGNCPDGDCQDILKKYGIDYKLNEQGQITYTLPLEEKPSGDFSCPEASERIVEKIVEKPVEKIVYVEKGGSSAEPKIVEKIVYRDKIVEKIVETPVEKKIVEYRDREVIKEVPAKSTGGTAAGSLFTYGVGSFVNDVTKAPETVVTLLDRAQAAYGTQAYSQYFDNLKRNAFVLGMKADGYAGKFEERALEILNTEWSERAGHYALGWVKSTTEEKLKQLGTGLAKAGATLAAEYTLSWGAHKAGMSLGCANVLAHELGAVTRAAMGSGPVGFALDQVFYLYTGWDDIKNCYQSVMYKPVYHGRALA